MSTSIVALTNYAGPDQLAAYGYLDALQQDEEKRRGEMRRAWRYYEGDHERQLRKARDGSDHNVTLNYARLLVNAGVAALAGKDLRLAVPKQVLGTRRPEDHPAQQALDAWMGLDRQVNQFALAFQKLATSGSVTGHCWYWLAPRPGRPPRLRILDPDGVTFRLDPEEPDVVDAYRYEWDALGRDGKPVTYRKETTRQANPAGETVAWLITDKVFRGRKWELINQTTWEFEWPPIGDCQNIPHPLDYWGVPDLTPDILDLQDAINSNASNTRRIIHFHAHPKPWVSGAGAGELPSGPEDMWVLPQPEARAGILEMQGDLAGTLNYQHLLHEAFHEITRLPTVAAGKLEQTGQLSGVALSILYGPLVELTEAKRRSYGPMLCELGRRVLELSGIRGVTPTVPWPEVVPHDPEGEAAMYEAHKRLGVSKHTILSRLEYDADAELERSQDEALASAEAQARLFDAGRGPRTLDEDE